MPIVRKNNGEIAITRLLSVDEAAALTHDLEMFATTPTDARALGTILFNSLPAVGDFITVNGHKFVFGVDLPIGGNEVTQVETATVAGAITGDGNVSAVLTAAGMPNSPKTIPVAVLNGDTAAIVAGKVRAALAADADVASYFNVGGSGVSVVLTKKFKAGTDATLNISLATGTATGLTAAPTSANTSAGADIDDTGNKAASVLSKEADDIATYSYDSATNTITIMYRTFGSQGNEFTLAKSGASLTVSGATLTGGALSEVSSVLANYVE